VLAPTPSAMGRLLQICDNYAKEYSITFNASKSKCMYIPPYKCRAFRLNQRPVFYIADHPLVYVNEYSHLGHIISSNSDDKADIINRRNILCGQINNVLCYFGRCCSVVKQRLLFTYCYSLYGSVLWDLVNPCVESVCTAWRKGLRRAWGLPADTHCALLPILSNSLPVIDELAKRSVRFIQNCLDSDSLVVRTMSSYGVYVGRMLSPIGRNAFFSCSRFSTKINDLSKLTVTQMRRHYQSALNDEIINTTSVLLELLFIRDGAYSFDFDTDEVNMFISCISRQ